MGTPAVVEGNRIIGTCTHLIPAGAGTAPAPFPFSGPLSEGLVDKVFIGGKKAAVLGSSGASSPAHPGIHASDPFFEAGGPRRQVGRITSGSSTVFIGGKPAASLASTATCCVVPGKLVPGVPTVLIG